MIKLFSVRSVFVFAIALCVLAGSAWGVKAISQSWTGSGDGASWSDVDNWSVGVPSNGDVLAFDNSGLLDDADMTNDISNLVLGGLTFSGSGDTGFGISGNTIHMAGNITATDTGAFIDSSLVADGNINVNALGTDFLDFVALTNVNIGAHTLTLNNQGSSFIAVNRVTGTTGKVTVTGNSGNDGMMFMFTGSLISRPTYVQSSGILAGAGKISNKTVVRSTGTIMPSGGCLNTGSLVLDGRFLFIPGGSSICSGYPRLGVTGSADVGGSALVFTGYDGGYIPAKGTKFTIISNDGTDKVIGTFSNRPEGKIFKIGVRSFKITYKGGTGNDVVITRI